MKKRNPFSPLFILMLFATGQLLSSCSGSQPYYFSKGTGSFNDSYKTKSNAPGTLTAAATPGISASDLSALIEEQITVETAQEVTQDQATEKVIIQKPSRRQLKQLKKQLDMVLDTTKKRDRVTVQTNEKKVDDLRNEVEGLKKSVKAEKSGDKVVVSFDKPQTSLSTEVKILIAVVAALLLVALLSLPIIGPVLGIILGIAVVAVALALVLGVIEIR